MIIKKNKKKKVRRSGKLILLLNLNINRIENKASNGGRRKRRGYGIKETRTGQGLLKKFNRVTGSERW